MIVARDRAELSKALTRLREGGATLALVPTMGALHDGHLGLVGLARTHATHAVASIFVNPTQFAPNEDLASYPRDEAGDLAALEGAGCTLAYLPSPDEVYPPGDQTRVVPGALAEPMEGACRPGFFTGVCTVVAKLLVHAAPDAAVFGEKDYQQLLVVRRMVTDLGLGVAVHAAPTARAADGLALSSRNRYLSPEERARAARLPETLGKVATRVRGGVAANVALAQGLSDLEAAGFAPDYLELRRGDDLAAAPARPLRAPEADQMRLFVAARLGPARLIDNRPL